MIQMERDESKAIAESLQAIAEARAKAFKASAEAENARDQVYEALAKVDAGISNEDIFDLLMKMNTKLVGIDNRVTQTEVGIQQLLAILNPQQPKEIYVDDEAKLTLRGFVHHYIKLKAEEKNRKLNDLLYALDFNQVVIFVKSVNSAVELDRLFFEAKFPSMCIHSGMSQEERLKRYRGFKEGYSRILVATDLVGRGIDIERVNIVINYDTPDSADTYLHRVGRAGRFGTKGLAITFVSCSSDVEVINNVQSMFEIDITEQIDTSTYVPS